MGMLGPFIVNHPRSGVVYTLSFRSCLSLSLYVCMPVCLSDDNFRKPWRRTFIFANFTALSSIQPDLLPIEGLHCGNRKFLHFFAPVTLKWPDDLSIRTWPVSAEDVPANQKWTFYVKDVEIYRITDWQTDRQTDASETYYHTASWLAITHNVSSETSNAAYLH